VSGSGRDVSLVVLEQLIELLGSDRVVTDPDDVAALTTTWTGARPSGCLAVVRPQTAAAAAEVLRWCTESGVAAVPAGGLTGLVGGTLCTDPHIAISTSAMSAVLSVDAVAGRITLGAGATIAAAQGASPQGWRFPVDFGARDSATVGGAIATNAGGLRVMRHGTMRQNLVGIQFVTGDGLVVDDLRGLEKDNTGYSLAQLVAGSEGTLGLITAATLRLAPAVGSRETALVGCADVATAVALVGRLRRRIPGLEVAELISARGMNLVGEAFNRLPPFPADAYLLVESVSSEPAPDGRLAEELMAESDNLLDTAVAGSSRQREDLFWWRESLTEAIARHRPQLKLDISLPPAELAGGVAEFDAIVEDSGADAEMVLYGHVGDSSLHLSILGATIDAGSLEERLMVAVGRRSGSPSAEHGIGRVRVAQLPARRSTEELQLFMRLKAALDPAGILNPGVLLDPAKGRS